MKKYSDFVEYNEVVLPINNHEKIIELAYINLKRFKEINNISLKVRYVEEDDFKNGFFMAIEENKLINNFIQMLPRFVNDDLNANDVFLDHFVFIHRFFHQSSDLKSIKSLYKNYTIYLGDENRERTLTFKKDINSLLEDL